MHAGPDIKHRKMKKLTVIIKIKDVDKWNVNWGDEQEKIIEIKKLESDITDVLDYYIDIPRNNLSITVK